MGFELSLSTMHIIWEKYFFEAHQGFWTMCSCPLHMLKSGNIDIDLVRYCYGT
jgi:hypothetical protein